MRLHPRFARLGLVICAVVFASTVGLAAPAYAGLHIFSVSPAGSGSDCTTSSPCDFMTAVSAVAGDDEIVMAPGSYPETGAYSTTISLPADVITTGTLGQPAVINSSSADAIQLQSGDRLSWVHVNAFSASQVISATGGTIDHVTAAGGGADAVGTCVLNGATLTDSLCVATAGAAVYAQPSAEANVIRNVTAVAASQHGIGLQADGTGTGDTKVTASNSIFRGTAYDVQSTATDSGTAHLTIDHSDFATVHDDANVTVTTANLHNVRAAPKFTDDRNADFSEAAGSPTINAGSKTGVTGADTDLAGRPRVLGPAPDIGAYEFVPAKKPELHHFKVADRGRHSIKLKVTVVPLGLRTTVTFVASRAGHRHSVVKHVPATGSQAITAWIRHLNRHRGYTLHVRARSQAGHVRSRTLTARTK